MSSIPTATAIRVGPPATPGRAAWVVLAFGLVTALALTIPMNADQRVRVGVYENSPKVGYSDTGKPQGVFIDLVEAIAEKEGWSLEYVPGTWDEGLDRLAAGEIDLMPDVALTPEREQRFAFHREPVLSSWNQIYARRGSGIRSLADLEGRRVAVLEGSVQQDLFQQMVGAFGFGVVLVEFPDYDSAFREVSARRADAVVTNRFYGAKHAPAAALEDTAIIFAPSRLYFAAPKSGNPALLASIDRRLLAFKKDSTSVYFRSMRRWTTDEVEPIMPRWLAYTALGGVLLLVAAAAWLVLLRRQVSTRTAIIRLRNEQLAIVNRTLRVIGASLDLRMVLDEATRGALEMTGCDYGMLSLRAPESDELHVGARVRRPGVEGDAFADEAFRGVSCPPLRDVEAMQNRPTLVAAASGGSPRMFEGTIDPATRWIASFPLERQGEIVGLLCLFSREAEPPSTRAVELVQELCVPVALAMENARLYEQVREHAEELEERVEDRTRELEHAMVAAESADRLKSAFLATMSHELRTPLNSIIGFTSIVCQGLAGPLNDEQQRQLNMVRESARHLLALINDVLDISKIEAGELEVATEPFDLSDSIRKVVSIVGPLVERRALALAVRVEDGVGPMVGDARRVEQVLLNLLGNAIKFTEKGTISLTVEPFATTPSGEGATPIAVVRIRVADTGIGIKADEMAQLFRPFRQIDSTIFRRHEGTGLGLAICRRLTALMGGTIEAESRWGEGSVFTLILPVHPSGSMEG